jgi:hypothetical protein
MTLIQKYCSTVQETGKEIRINITDAVTESLYNKVLKVADTYDISCHVDRVGFLLKPRIK